MQKLPLNPDVADAAPIDSMLTPYDHEHLITYLRLLDADAEGADWREVARIVLHIDPEREPARARRAHESSSGSCFMDDRTRLSVSLAWRRAERQLIEPLRYSAGRACPLQQQKDASGHKPIDTLRV
jgi:Uncharacterized conserved protein (DUF2285)